MREGVSESTLSVLGGANGDQVAVMQQEASGANIIVESETTDVAGFDGGIGGEGVSVDVFTDIIESIQ